MTDLKVIDAIRNDQEPINLVNQCDAQTQESFKELEQFLPGGAKRKDFEKLIGLIRHNLAFHYNESGKMIKKAISDRATRPGARTTSITRGDTAYLWHFKIADDIIDSIVVRQIWKIPISKDLRIEANRVANQIHHISLRFVDFSGEFIWKYCGN